VRGAVLNSDAFRDMIREARHNLKGVGDCVVSRDLIVVRVVTATIAPDDLDSDTFSSSFVDANLVFYVAKSLVTPDPERNLLHRILANLFAGVMLLQQSAARFAQCAVAVHGVNDVW
jgi:hypothetical protein